MQFRDSETRIRKYDRRLRSFANSFWRKKFSVKQELKTRPFDRMKTEFEDVDKAPEGSSRKFLLNSHLLIQCWTY